MRSLLELPQDVASVCVTSDSRMARSRAVKGSLRLDYNGDRSDVVR